jgi:hypothetical protein
MQREWRDSATLTKILLKDFNERDSFRNLNIKGNNTKAAISEIERERVHWIEFIYGREKTCTCKYSDGLCAPENFRTN